MKRFDYIDCLKFIAIIMVVSLHVSLWSTDFVASSSLVCTLEYGFRLMSEGVPLFVTINGFLMLRKETFVLKAHVKKILHLTFLIFFWSIALTGISFILGFETTETVTVSTIISCVFEPDFGLWFLEGLLGLYVLYPAIWKIYQSDFTLYKYIFAAATVYIPGHAFLLMIRDACLAGNQVAWISSILAFIEIQTLSGTVAWFVYYCLLGGMIYRYKDRIKSYRPVLMGMGVFAWLAAFLSGYLLSLRRGEVYNCSFNYGSIFMVFMILGLFAFTIDFKTEKNAVNRLISSIGKHTFGIYVSHMLIIKIVSRFFIADSFADRTVMLVVAVSAGYIFALFMAQNQFLRKLVSL